MTAKCSIVQEEVKNVFAVPYDAVHEKSDGTHVIYVEGDNKDFKIYDNDEENKGGESQGSSGQREIVVTKGMESDYNVEISGEDLYEGMKVIIPTDEVTTPSDEKDSQKNSFDMFGNGGGRNGMERGSRDGEPAGRER